MNALERWATFIFRGFPEGALLPLFREYTSHIISNHGHETAILTRFPSANSYEHEDSVEACLSVSSHVIKGHTLTGVERAAPRGPRPEQSHRAPGRGGYGMAPMLPTEHQYRIIVKELPETATDDDLTAHFRRFGAISDVYIPKGKVINSFLYLSISI